MLNCTILKKTKVKTKVTVIIAMCKRIMRFGDKKVSCVICCGFLYKFFRNLRFGLKVSYILQTRTEHINALHK